MQPPAVRQYRRSYSPSSARIGWSAVIWIGHAHVPQHYPLRSPCALAAPAVRRGDAGTKTSRNKSITGGTTVDCVGLIPVILPYSRCLRYSTHVAKTRALAGILPHPVQKASSIGSLQLSMSSTCVTQRSALGLEKATEVC